MRRLVIAILVVSAFGCSESEVNNLFPTPATTPPADATFANGFYTGDGQATSNGCSLNGKVTATGTINVDKDGKGRWTKSHTSAGGLFFLFTIQLKVTSATSGTFTATTEQDIGADSYDVTDTGALTGASMLTVTQTFTRKGKPCSTVYDLTFRKQ